MAAAGTTVTTTSGTVLPLALQFLNSSGSPLSSSGGALDLPLGTYRSEVTVALSAPGVYTITLLLFDITGDSLSVTETLRADGSGPVITESLTAPVNGVAYDVGQMATFSYGVADATSTATVSATLDGSIPVPSGSSGPIDAIASAGSHTVVETATDKAGVTSTTTLTFQVHATVAGLISAVNDGVQMGNIAASDQQALLTPLQGAQTALGNNDFTTAQSDLSALVSKVQSLSGAGIDASYASLLVGWIKDLQALM
jgi:hypothetical protein